MGICFSSQAKVERPSNSGHTVPGSIPTYENVCATEANDISSSKVSSLRGEILPVSNLRSFTFTDLKIATRNFRPESVLGEGGFGYVFKGCVDDLTATESNPGRGIIVAVKRPKCKDFRGHAEWLAQIKFLGQLHHPNLVKLIGYCVQEDERLLVHEFIARGSLENHLFRRGSYFQPLSWKFRLKVALGAAKGLAFLHSPEAASVIYSHFKTSSILIDLNYNAKLSDFGLAKDEPADDNSHLCARIVGTHEYAAPEFIEKGHLTAKSNVYSFGVVLLEMISGRRALDTNRPAKETNLVQWAKPYLANIRKVVRVLDNRLEGQYTADAAHSAAILALRCLSTEAKLRPTMEHVAQQLERLMNQMKPQLPKLN